MNALIIENDNVIPNNVAAFVRDQKGLFTTVSAETFCRFKSAATIMSSIKKADALIVSSTFDDQDKLKVELIAEAITKGPLRDKNYLFFIFDILDYCNKWNTASEGTVKGFNKYLEFLCNLRTLVERHQLINIRPDRRMPMVRDRYFRKEPYTDDKRFTIDRYPYVYCPLSYSKKDDRFYEDPRILRSMLTTRPKQLYGRQVKIEICKHARI